MKINDTDLSPLPLTFYSVQLRTFMTLRPSVLTAAAAPRLSTTNNEEALKGNQEVNNVNNKQ